MIFTDIKYLIGIHLGEKGLPATIITPVLNILTLADEELAASGFDFGNPEIVEAIARLDNAIENWNTGEELTGIERMLKLEPAKLPSLFDSYEEKEETDGS